MIDDESMESGSVIKLAEKIFTYEPLQNNSIQLVLDESDSQYVSELLFNLLNEGIKIMFNKNIREMLIGEITEENISIINERFKAICFKVHVDKRLYTEPPYRYVDGNQMNWFKLDWSYIHPNLTKPELPAVCEYIYQVCLEDGEVALCFENITLSNPTEYF